MTIAPLMILLEISIVDVCFNYISSHWFSIVIVCLLVLTALYLNSLSVPFPTFSRKRGCTVKPLPLFAMFPYLFAIGISWVICVILTATDALPPGSKARTDLRISVLSAAPWFQWPYPGQFGPASFNAGLFLGFVAGTVASVIESVGDYYACARVCGERAPPSHAVNRGIAVEGVGCMVSGMLGGGVGVTTYSENIGVIGITGVASRRTMQAAGAFMILLGVLTKIGALFATIPDPIIGGILTLSLAMVGGVGLSSVQLIDLKLSRNVAILGFSIMSGLLIPKIVRAHPPNTGSQTADDSLKILLTIDMFIGGVMGFFLDNTVPGATREERGLRGKGEGKVGVEAGDAYAFPPRVSALLARLPTRYLPFLPNPASG